MCLYNKGYSLFFSILHILSSAAQSVHNILKVWIILEETYGEIEWCFQKLFVKEVFYNDVWARSFYLQLFALVISDAICLEGKKHSILQSYKGSTARNYAVKILMSFLAQDGNLPVKGAFCGKIKKYIYLSYFVCYFILCF